MNIDICNDYDKFGGYRIKKVNMRMPLFELTKRKRTLSLPGNVEIKLRMEMEEVSERQ